MIIAIDVHYRENFAKAISVEFDNWEDASPLKIQEVIIDEVAEYIPGEFYKRELPCILEVLKESDLSKVELIIVDGYVVLDDEGRWGLGAYLYEALDSKIPIVGVAKKSFISNKKNVFEVLRGESKNPLYVSSMGFDMEEAARRVGAMNGKYRIPTLLKILDQHTKG